MVVVCNQMRMGRWSELMVVCVCHSDEVMREADAAVKMRVAVEASHRRYRSSHWLYDNPQRFEDQNILNVPNTNILYTGSWCLG